jgi:hypothetical protein
MPIISVPKEARDNQDKWIDLPQPRNYEECQRRPDAILFRLAFLKEVGAFEKLKVMSFGHTKSLKYGLLRISDRAYGAGHEGGRRRGDAGVHERV